MSISLHECRVFPDLALLAHEFQREKHKLNMQNDSWDKNEIIDGKNVSPQKSRWGIGVMVVCAGIALLLLADRTGLFSSRALSDLLGQTPSQPVPLVFGPPMQEVILPNGGKMLIDGMAEERLLFGTLERPSSGSHSSSTSGGGSGWDDIRFQRVSVDEQMIGVEITGVPSSLVMACRFTHPDGTRTSIQADDDLLDAAVTSKNDPAAKWQAMLEADAYQKNLPAILIQLADGAGGWIDMLGPYHFSPTPDDLCVIYSPIWPRSQAELSFRAVQPGQEPFSWTMPNPLHPIKPQTWPLSEVPQTISRNEFELTFEGVSAPAETPNALYPHMTFQSKVPGDEEIDANRKSLQAVCEEVQGPYGTRSLKKHFRLKGGYLRQAHPLPPEETLLRCVVAVSPTEYYRFPREDAHLLLSGTVAKDGKSVSLDTSNLKPWGLVSATANISTEWEITLAFAWETQAANDAAMKALRLENPQFVIFENDATRSTGYVSNPSGSTSGNGEKTEKELTIRWEGIPVVEKNYDAAGKLESTSYTQKMPAPGSTIHLGTVIPRQKQLFYFVVPRPAP
jgi:hypothetical protein